MSGLGEIRFECPACGAWEEEAEAGACARCGHRFEPGAAPTVPRPAPRRPEWRMRPVDLPNPIPAAPPSPSQPWTFRIGPALAVIALIAACLGAFRAQVVLGLVTTVALAPGAIRTLYVADRMLARGSPMGLDEQILFFAGEAVFGVFILMGSAIVGFLSAVVGAAGFGGDWRASIAFGGAAAVAFAVFLWRALFRNHRPVGEGIRFDDRSRGRARPGPFEDRIP